MDLIVLGLEFTYLLFMLNWLPRFQKSSYEPQRQETYLWTYEPSEDSDQTAY